MDQRYHIESFNPLNTDHKVLKDRLALLHRRPGKVRAVDFGLDPSPAAGLTAETVLPFPVPVGKGLSCFDFDNIGLKGHCHVVDARENSLAPCSFEVAPTDVFTLIADNEVKLVHWVVRPTVQMRVNELESHWNYPRRPVLQRELDIANERRKEANARPSRQREWQRAHDTLAAFDQAPQEPGTAAGQLQWGLCAIAGAAEPIELRHRLFDDPNLQMIAYALRAFVDSTIGSDNDCILAYLLYYSFGQSDTAVSFSKPNALSASARSLIYFSLENLLNDTDEFDMYELDELDAQRLRSLMTMFQPIVISQ